MESEYQQKQLKGQFSIATYFKFYCKKIGEKMEKSFDWGANMEKKVQYILKIFD